MKVALVYDRVNRWGGAERVLLALHEIFPEAPLYTSVYDLKTAGWASVFKTVPSFLQKISFFRKNHEKVPFLMPLAFESFNFDEFDVVISITSEAAKGIVTKPRTLHLCYCLTPTRYLWSGYEEYLGKRFQGLGISYLVNYLRKWDKVACRRPDEYISISKTVQDRIKKYYERDSQIIYPPVDIEKFEIRNSKHETNSKFKIQNSKFFLVVSRLVKYKKVDLVVEAFNELGWNLKIVGVGGELTRLRNKSKSNIKFLGNLTDEQLLLYYQTCKAVIFPQEEDFGIVPLEAMACGKPVIAYKAGGAAETIIDGKTGLFFSKQNIDELVRVLREFEGCIVKIKPEDCRKQAEKFSKEKFKIEFKELVEEKWKKHKKSIYIS